ncbi:MAG: M23 family metallopeptidase [bacterium]|nr:M23 family metallopeptidase [bacterium]
METYTLIFVRDQRARPVQIAIPKVRVRQAAIGLAVAVLIGCALTWDYWRLRADNAELADLRVEALEQREQIAVFRTRLETVDTEIAKVTELERKVRIIANLPGTAGVGGEGVAELAPQGVPVGPPAGVPVDQTKPPQGLQGQGGGQPLPEIGEDVSGIRVLENLGSQALELSAASGDRVDSLESLLEQLEDKRQRLVSMPSIWPAKGWLTSRFGPRVSPFTGRKQLHAGIDIAAASGTSIYAPARGRVSFVGRKGPLGKTVVLDHGFGVKTVYGHTKEIHVSTGETVERGQEIAAIGSTGRSTGPHLHYVVEVNGKARDPLDYIFD